MRFLLHFVADKNFLSAILVFVFDEFEKDDDDEPSEGFSALIVAVVIGRVMWSGSTSEPDSQFSIVSFLRTCVGDDVDVMV